MNQQSITISTDDLETVKILMLLYGYDIFENPWDFDMVKQNPMELPITVSQLYDF